MIALEPICPICNKEHRRTIPKECDLALRLRHSISCLQSEPCKCGVRKFWDEWSKQHPEAQ